MTTQKPSRRRLLNSNLLLSERPRTIDKSNSESPEFIGRVIAALSCDPHLMERSGQVVIAAKLARELNVCDTDGKQPVPLTLDVV